jgi:choline dehydrogenase-like flavoprotein
VIHDAEARQPDWFAPDRFDVCIVGSGPAGLALALTLAERGYRVAVMEGGGEAVSHDSQDLYDGDLVGTDYYPLDVTRLRFLGGSSNHWIGYCRPLDAHDFERQPFHALSGWPISKADLGPYAARVDAFFKLEPDTPPEESAFGSDTGRFEHIRFRFSGVQSVADANRATLEASDNLHLFLNANLVDITLDDRLQAVTGLVFRSFARDEPFRVQARLYALCLGGLENPRALLNANRQVATGIGNQHDLVGRHFTEHPHHTLGRIVLEAPMRGRQFYAPTPAFMAEHEVLNFGLRFIADVGERSLGAELMRSVACVAPFMERLAEAVRGSRMRCKDGGLLTYLDEQLDREALHGAKLRCAAEQAVNRDSRITLSRTRTDRFGLPRLELDWRINEIDTRTIKTAAVEFGRLLAERRVGRLKLDPWLLEEPVTFPGIDTGAEVGGHHHMCTTRMSDDPRQGVVDRNCRIHGLDNLYLGGCSTFATGGHANPTYTITQLAFRLADHLDAVLEAERQPLKASSPPRPAATAGG